MSNDKLPPPGKAFPSHVPMPDKTKPSPEYKGWGEDVGGADGYIMKHRSPHPELQHTEMLPTDAAQLWDLALKQIPWEFPYERKMVDVYGCNMAYVDEGEGDPIVFIHGAPESSYIWRNIMPFLKPYGRIIAPDLPGHGHSDKPDMTIRFPDYVNYVDGFIEKLNLKNMTLVMHDWGTIIGSYYASRHPDNVQGVAFMEALMCPFYPITDPKAAAKERPGKASAIHHYLIWRQTGTWDLTINQNFWVEKILQEHTVRKIDERTMDYYRDPFRKAEWREPLYWWAVDISLDGDAPATEYAMNHYNEWYLKKTIPSMEVYGFPGEGTNEYDVRWRVENFKNHETAFMGPGLHFVQEDHPEIIGRAIADWYRRNLAPKSNVWMTDVGPADMLPKNLKFPGSGE